ncbi:hypothetical protein [Halorussus lipolyticus]|uniref:hypothetical protein n=1 Tax=Halorussus lipolyticus TaxID=3034024 RepID=UPI0023E7C295|nr:hypothetical protein [Halorussus sp. DT80]
MLYHRTPSERCASPDCRSAISKEFPVGRTVVGIYNNSTDFNRFPRSASLRRLNLTSVLGEVTNVRSKFNEYNEKVQEKLGQVLVRSDSPKKVADGGQNYVELLADLDDIDSKTARRLNKIERDGEDVTPLVQAYKNGDIDGDDLRRASKLLDNDNKEYLSGDDITINELLEITDKTD